MTEQWINYREAFTPRLKSKKALDVPLSKLMNKDIVVGTPPYRKAVHLINKWNNARSEDDLRSIDYLKEESKVKQLKEVLR